METRAGHFRRGRLSTFLPARAAISVAANKFIRTTLDVNEVLLARLAAVSRPILADIDLDFCAAEGTGKHSSSQGFARATLRASPGGRQETHDGSY